MPTVLCGGGKLSSVSVVSTVYQVIRSQSCAADVLEDMTQSWPTQQALGGDQAQRILYSQKEAKSSALQQRQGRGDVPRMTRRPHVAPHKSMLVDDLRISSDEDEDQRKSSHESASWDGQRVSAHTHGRRVRNSSSDSSGSDATVHSIGSSSSSLPSRSPTADPDPPSPPSTGLPDNQETDLRSSAQWQLDKWLNSQEKLGGGDHYSNQSIPGRLPPLQRAPSPASCWDNSNQEYSPVPSPQFSYSPLLSSGDRACPSPGPLTAASPASVAGYGPDPSDCLRGSPLPKERPPLPQEPPHCKSQQNPKHLPTVSHRPKPTSHHNKSTKTSDASQRSKTRPSDKRRDSAPTVPSHSYRAGSPLSHSKPRHSEQSHRSIQSHKPSDSQSSQRRPAAHCKTSNGQQSQSSSNSASHSKSRCSPSRQLARLEHGGHSKITKRKPQSKEEESRRETPAAKADRRSLGRREGGRKKGEVQGKPDQKDRRLAEEQLLRRSWIQSSTEEEEEEVVAEERQRRRERQGGRGITSRGHEWKAAKPKQGLTERGDLSVPPSDCPTPDRLSPSSTASSNSESDYEAKITKVPADSTSHKRLRTSHSAKASCRSETSAGVQQKRRLYTLVPFGRSDEASTLSQRGLRNLVVQIDLCLLKRVPDSSASQPSSISRKDKPAETMKHLSPPETNDSKRKRRLENGVSDQEGKKNIPDAGEDNFSTQTIHNGILEEYLDSKRPMSPLSPLSDSPEPNKQKPRCTEMLQKKNCAVKPKLEVDCIKVSRHSQPSTEPWSSAGLRGTVSNSETPHHAEYYLHEAKRMKHRADAMVDKLGKAVNYVDAALSFMECGKAMEEGPLEAKSPYTMYSETVELIRYAMRLKSHSGPGARQEEKQLAVLCFRCLALLYWQMFRLKKDHALKYSKVLLDYFKTSKVPTLQLSWNDTLKDAADDPSSLSSEAKQRRRGSHGDRTSPSHISIPHRIHQMAANHLNITNSVLYSYEYWEVADNLAKESKEFFNYLNTLSGPLTLHSSIAHAVQYTRQALQWIRISAKLN
ncbi:AF4/FMR2 family member 3 isoform X2 [Synchiropus splendidus]|uniref:AF4/FMR2 family member 3 isoform X2 n=1 Tax=Synchiropus splendidus TaxID=270530 RepID=UPI00237D5ACD|nr:AF4/FMR2 family member 3 isoform X2 [Synchiropus splendidus]